MQETQMEHALEFLRGFASAHAVLALAAATGRKTKEAKEATVVAENLAKRMILALTGRMATQEQVASITVKVHNL